MNLIELFEESRQEDNFGLILDVIFDGKANASEIALLSQHIEKIFFNLGLRERTSVLFVLSKISPENAHRLARKDLEKIYHETCLHTSYLSQIIATIDNIEHILRSFSAIEVEKNLRTAHILINQANQTPPAPVPNPPAYQPLPPALRA